MSYRLMVIDDRITRHPLYEKVLSGPDLLEPLYIWTPSDLARHRDTPVDGYLIDAFLDSDWGSTTAAALLRKDLVAVPRAAPVFLISQLWGDTRALDILKQAGESSAKIVQYFAWSEFEQATEDNEGAERRLQALRLKLVAELDRWHGRSGFRSGPDQTICILLLADPQFGDRDTSLNATFAENWIAQTLKREHRDGGLPLPELIVVAGDLTHSGRPDQFALAEERLTLDLMGPLWGVHNIERMRDRVIVVPGNHDVNLRFSAAEGRLFSPGAKEFKADEPVCRNDNGQPYPGHKEYGLEPFRRFAHTLTRHRNWRDASSMSWVDRRFLDCGIRFFILNTVEDLDAVAPSRASFNERTMRNLTRSLADEAPEGLFSIAVSHHGLRPEGAGREEEVDNWNGVGRDFFSLHKIRLWIYGHYHSFNRRSINGSPFADQPLWMVQLPTTRIYPSTRGFCMLELERKAGTVVDAHIHQYVLQEDGTARKEPRRRVFGNG